MSVKKVSSKKGPAKKNPLKKTRSKKVSNKKDPTKRKTAGRKASVKKKATTKKVAVKRAGAKKTQAKKPAHKKVPAKPKRQPYWLNRGQMSRSCGISTQAFDQWGVAPVEKIGRCTYYVVTEVLANRLEKQADQLQKVADATIRELERSEREEKLRLTKAQAEGQEIKNSQLRQELAPVALIEWVLGKVGGQISAILDALPLQLKKRNPKLTASNIETIRRDIAKTQNAAAQMTVDLDEYYDSKD